MFERALSGILHFTIIPWVFKWSCKLIVHNGNPQTHSSMIWNLRIQSTNHYLLIRFSCTSSISVGFPISVFTVSTRRCVNVYLWTNLLTTSLFCYPASIKIKTRAFYFWCFCQFASEWPLKPSFPIINQTSRSNQGLSGHNCSVICLLWPAVWRSTEVSKRRANYHLMNLP